MLFAVMKCISVLIIKSGLGALQAGGVFYCSPLSGSGVDHYPAALAAAHGHEISGGPRGQCCILLNG